MCELILLSFNHHLHLATPLSLFPLHTPFVLYISTPLYPFLYASILTEPSLTTKAVLSS